MGGERGTGHGFGGEGRHVYAFQLGFDGDGETGGEILVLADKICVVEL